MIASSFDYNEAEWAEIEASIQTAKKGVLRKSTRKALRTAAWAYISDAAERDKKSQLKDRWARVETLSQRLHRELSVIEWSGGESYDEWTKLRGYFATAGAGYVDLIGAIAKAARRHLEKTANPRLEYQSKVLEIWVQLGGNLRISRHYRSQRVQGPLAKYFFAVVRPVMGEATPSPESLPGIVKRQKLSTPQPELITQEPKWYDFRARYIRFCAQLEAGNERMEADNQRIEENAREVDANIEVLRAKDAADRAVDAVKLALSGNGEAQKEIKPRLPINLSNV